MRGKSVFVGCLVVSLLVSAVPVGAQLAESGAAISVSEATVSPETPSVGEPVTVTPTIENLESSNGSVQIHAVRLEKSAEPEILESINSPGAIAAGGQMTVPLSATFEEPGRQVLEVYVRGTDENSNTFELEYPVVVDVSAESGVQVSLSADEAVAGAETTVNATVANGDQSAIRNLRLNLGGAGVTLDDPRRVNASLSNGSQRTFTYDGTFAESGQQTIDATLQYTNAGGASQTVTESTAVTVEELTENVAVDTETSNDNGTSVVTVEVANYGNAPLENVALTAESADGAQVTRSLDDVEDGNSTETTIRGSRLPSGSVQFVATYTTGGRQGQAETTIDYQPAATGQLQLSGVEATSRVGTVTVAGDVANVGLADATGVTVSAVDTEGVTPTSDYFVGTVESSDYIAFEVEASTRGNHSSIPVEVAYSVNGERRTQQVDVSLAGGGGAASMAAAENMPEDAGPGGPGGGGGMLSLPFGELLGTLLTYLVPIALVVGGVFAWRRYRGDE